MSTERDDHHDHDVGADPVTDHVHDNSWSADLEGPDHAEDREFLVAQALSAVTVGYSHVKDFDTPGCRKFSRSYSQQYVEHTAPGNHVNLVTHGEHGHPETYLYDALESECGDRVAWEYVDRCGCGGHVVRVRT